MATKSVVVTKGASFVGVHLIENLLRARHHVCIVDNFERMEVLEDVIDRVEIVRLEIAKNPSGLTELFRGYDTVFHLADTYGGCNATHYEPAHLSKNTVTDNVVIDSAAAAGVNHIQLCSSNCTHSWQSEMMQAEYGLSKWGVDSLLKTRCEEFGMKGSIVKLTSTYGPGQSETHLVMALIAKAFVHQDPYEVPNGGLQHNFTYVKDVAECMRRAAEKISDCSQVIVSTHEQVTINRLMEIVFDCVGWTPYKVNSNPTEHIIDSNYAIASSLDPLEFRQWRNLSEGIKETADWYMSTHTRSYVENNLQLLLQGIPPEHPRVRREYRTATKVRRLTA